MADVWTIKGLRDVGGVQTLTDIATVHDPEYHGGWMDDCFVTVSVKSAEPIDWHFDDYLIYRGETFSISYDPNVVKKARRGTYGEGFTYDNVKFFSLGYKLRNIGFKDVVLYDNQQTYTSLSTFSFFAGSAEDLADRLAANLGRESQPLVPGGFIVLTPSASRTQQRYGSLPSAWNEYFNGDEPSGESDVNIDIDKQTCRDVMKLFYEKFGLSYYMVDNLIIVGSKPIHLNTGAQGIFRYGKGLGLYEIERTSDENIELVTKLFAYGSEKNIPLNYYANAGKRMITPGQRVTSEVDGTTVYGLETLLPYDTVMAATNEGKGVTLGYDGYTVIADCKPYTVSEMRYVLWQFNGGSDFYNALGDGIKVVYVVAGASINMWPASAIETPTGYQYPAALSVNRLMLPGFPAVSLNEWVTANHPELLTKYIFSTDKNDPWIKSRNADEIGVFEGNVNFDGSQQEEIYPTIVGATDGDGRRLDEVLWAEQMEDNGYLGDNPAEQSLRFSLMPMGDPTAIDWNDHNEEVSISMKDGACVGRTFKMSRASRNDNGDWELTFEREQDSATGRFYPYKETAMAANLFQVMGRGNYQGEQDGDHFIITGINMQPSFIEAAAERMLIAACGWLDRRDHMRYTYLPKIDEIFMKRDHDARGTQSYYHTIHAGMMMEFEDSDLGIWHTPYIDSLTIKENGNNGIPTFEVVLRDEKEKGTLEKLIDNISELMANPPVQVVERQRRNLQIVEYPEWVSGNSYYFETLNTETGVLETSEVWHRGCLWMCLRTLTQEEPWFTSEDWKCVRADTLSLDFFDSLTNPMPIYGLSVRPANINERVVPYLLISQDDISSTVTEWRWARDSGYPDLDALWNGTHSGIDQRVLNLTTFDFPSGWDVNGGKVKFTCTAIFPWDGENAQISNVITVT